MLDNQDKSFLLRTLAYLNYPSLQQRKISVFSLNSLSLQFMQDGFSIQNKQYYTSNFGTVHFRRSCRSWNLWRVSIDLTKSSVECCSRLHTDYCGTSLAERFHWKHTLPKILLWSVFCCIVFVNGERKGVHLQ